MNKIDHFVFHHKLGSIFCTLLFIIAVFLIFCIFKPAVPKDANSSFEYLVGIFTQGLLNWQDKGNLYDIYLLLMSIFGTFLLSGLFYAVIANALIGRTDVYKDGKLRYKLADHTIIFGSNSLLESTLAYLDKNEKFKKEEPWLPQGWRHIDLEQLCKAVRHRLFSNYIVIVSSHKPQTIRNRANRYGFIRKHVVIYNDELDDDKVFKKVCLEKAREVYVLGDEEPKITDALNVCLVNLIIQKVDRCWDKGPLYCNVSYFDSSLLMAALSDMEGLPKKPYNIVIRPFNYLDGCLSFYWGNKCVERMYSNEAGNNVFSLMPAKGNAYHFVIFGFNDLTTCCVRKICSLAHFGKESHTTITMITNAKQQFEYFKEELGVKGMTDITLDFEENFDNLKTADDKALRYYVVATTDASMDNMLINHLSLQKHACLLGYAEDYDQVIDTKIKYFKTEEQHLGYWGFKKLRTLVSIGKQEYSHAQMLYEAYNSLKGRNNDFNKLNPMQQKAWMDFYSYLYYLLRVSGCSMQSKKEIDNRCDMTQEEISAASEKSQREAEAITLASLESVKDKIDPAMDKYAAAQKALHGVDSAAARDYKAQLENISGNYRKIVARYLSKANETGMKLVVSHD